MTWQQVGVLLIVGFAVAYLAWKLTAGSRARRARRARRGPDVPVSRLVRGGRNRRSDEDHSSSCH